MLVSITYKNYTDSRDGTVYPCVQMPDGKWWFAKNLSYASENSHTYNDDPINEAIYGRLYPWDDLASACPPGCHIPTDAEWTALTTIIGEDTASTKLKANSSLWSTNIGTDDYDFSVLPAGTRPLVGTFIFLGYYADFWTSSEFDASRAWYRQFHYTVPDVYRNHSDVANGLSLRCIVDALTEPTVIAPVITPAAGTYTDSVLVSLSAADNTSVHYTLDGSIPTIASALYTSAFVITSSCLVQAIALLDSGTASTIASASYTIQPSHATITANVLVCDLGSAAVYGVEALVSVPVTDAERAEGFTGTVQSDAVTGAFTLTVPSTPTFSIDAPTTPIYRKLTVTCVYDAVAGVVGNIAQSITVEVQPGTTLVVPDFVFQVGAIASESAGSTLIASAATTPTSSPYTGSLGLYPLFGAEADDYYNLIYGNTTLPGLPKGLFWDVRAVPVPFKPLEETSFVVVVDADGVDTIFRMHIYRETEPADSCSDVIDFIPDNEEYILNIRLGRGLNLFDIYTQKEDGTWGRVYSYSVTSTLYAALLHGYATVICSYATQPLAAFQQDLASPASSLLASPLISFDKLLPGKANLFRMAKQLVVDAQMQGAGQTAGVIGFGSALFQQTPLLVKPLVTPDLDINATWLRPLQTTGGTRNNLEYHVWSISNKQARQAALIAWYAGNHSGTFTMLESNDQLVRVQDIASGTAVVETHRFQNTDPNETSVTESDDTETAETVARTYWEMIVTSTMLFDGLGIGSGDFINWLREPAYVTFPGLYDNGADPYFDEGINFDSDARIGWDREDTSGDPDNSGFIGVSVTGETNATRTPGIGVGVIDRSVDEVTAVCAMSADFSLSAMTSAMPAPRIYPSAGTWSTPLSVSLAMPGNFITTLPVTFRYTVDGSDPSATVGTLYNGPITLQHSCVVKAITLIADIGISAIASNTFTVTYPDPAGSGFLTFDHVASTFTWQETQQ